MMQTRTRRISLAQQLRTGLLLALPLLLIVNGILWSGYTTLVERQREQWRYHAESGLDAALITIQMVRNDLYGDLLMLADSPNLKAALDESTAVHLARLAAEWEVFAAVKRRYDQIRWLDNRGMERLRVNLNPQGASRIGDDRLQDKSDRYYFKQAIAMPVGQVYASPIDLNIEHGEIERPNKPMLRLAVPVTDSRGVRRGLLLLNVLAEQILDGLARHAGLIQSHLLLIDSTGYYLWGFQRDQEWGFMFRLEDDARYRFDKHYPSVWRQMVQRGLGEVDTPQGQFLFRTLRYGSEGFGLRYYLVAARLRDELRDAQTHQRQLWLSASLAVSLALLLLAFGVAYYRAYCLAANESASGREGQSS
ncbi:MAG: cache domain-containing protein [Candidatus Thiodiazotropha sp.]|jgi:hypothetical protein